MCIHSLSSQLDITLDFFKNKGLDYIGDMADESFYTGETNDKYINDDKKIFGLDKVEEITDKGDVKNRIQSEDFFVVGKLKKDDRIIFNDLTMGKKILSNNK